MVAGLKSWQSWRSVELHTPMQKKQQSESESLSRIERRLTEVNTRLDEIEAERKRLLRERLVLTKLRYEMVQLGQLVLPELEP